MVDVSTAAQLDVGMMCMLQYSASEDCKVTVYIQHDAGTCQCLPVQAVSKSLVTHCQSAVSGLTSILYLHIMVALCCLFLSAAGAVRAWLVMVGIRVSTLCKGVHVAMMCSVVKAEWP